MKIFLKSRRHIERGSYDSLAAALREATGRKRLTPAQAAEVRAAVALHEARQANRPPAPPRPGRFLAEVEHRTRVAVEALVRKLYRTATSQWAGGETTVHVRLARNLDSYLDCEGKAVRVWSDNGKWSGHNAVLTVTVERGWIVRVAGVPGLAEAGGMLTLAARQVAPDCWQAAWAAQSRGFDLRVERGFIVRCADGSFAHGKTEAAARRVAQRRQIDPAEAEARRAARLERLRQVMAEVRAASAETLVARWGDVQVRVRDSLRAGNCAAGTRSWIARHAPGRESGSVREIVQAVSPQGLDRYVRAAIAVAVARATR